MTTTKRNSKGQFVKASKASKIQKLHSAGKSNAEIAKLLDIRPQNVFRALNRSKYGTKRVAADKVKKDPESCVNELCLNALSHLCECPCEGAGHGTALTELVEA
jgi:IS30 family transposase